MKADKMFAKLSVPYILDAIEPFTLCKIFSHKSSIDWELRSWTVIDLLVNMYIVGFVQYQVIRRLPRNALMLRPKAPSCSKLLTVLSTF